MHSPVIFRPGASVTVAPPANTGSALTTPLPNSASSQAVRLLSTGGDTLVGFDSAPAMRLAAGIPETFLVIGAVNIQSISATTTATSLNVTSLSR